MTEKSVATSNSSAKQLSVNQPTRGSDLNQDLVDRANSSTEDLLLPSLSGGITLLDVDGDRGVPVLQSLVLDHLLLNEGPAFWVDANGHATTTTLARIAPSQRLLDRIHIARGFTAYQHHSAVCDLSTAVNQFIQDSATDTRMPGRKPSDRDNDSSPYTPSLIVAPAVDAQYRTDDTLRKGDSKTLQARTLARLSTYAEAYDVPILITRSTDDEFTTSVATSADHHLKCEQTKMGPRFVNDEFETLVYPVEDGAYYQTTFTYWRQLLDIRAGQLGVEPATPSASMSTQDGVGAGVTASGKTTSMAGDPLFDAWTASDPRGR